MVGLVPLLTPCVMLQGYGWLKERILSDDGRKQQMQLRELSTITHRLGCTLAQLAIGKTIKTKFIDLFVSNLFLSIYENVSRLFMILMFEYLIFRKL